MQGTPTHQRNDLTMLRITISSDSEGAIAYFTQALSKEDYFFAEKAVTAKWQGKAAPMLGLEGNVTKEEFSQVVRNINPLTGKRLTVRHVSNRRAGYEYCFNAPKSISILYALTKDPEILKAHRNAVKAAMAYIEADMQTQAGSGSDKHYQATGNIVYAAFEHMTARPVESELDGTKMYIPDCHLHTHSFVPNVTWNEQEQRFQALEEGNIRRLAPFYEEVYHSNLSLGVQKCGYEVQRILERWEVKQVPKVVRDKFSNRTKQVDELAKLKGITDAKEKAELGAKTRLKKNKSIEEAKLYQVWENRLTPKELESIRTAKGEPKPSSNKITAKEAIEKALAHFLERQSAIPEKRVLAQAMKLGYGTLSPQDVENALANRDNILYAEKQTISYITTKEMARAEERMVEFAVSGKGRFTALNPIYEPRQKFLNEEQRLAIKELLSSQDYISILAGGAGVGKTSLLTEVKNGIEETGRKLLAVAPSAEASRGVLQDKGFYGSDTIASLLRNPEMQQQLKDNVLLVDEAGMVGVPTMLRLFGVAQKLNARIILSGDTKQHTSVEAGDALRLLQENAQVKTAMVRKVVRQKPEPYRQAVELLAKGQTLEGFKRLDKLGAVKEIEDTAQRQEEIAHAYLASVKQGRSALIVSPTHAEGQALSEVVRQKLKQSGIIKGLETTFDTQRDVSYTAAQKTDTANYREGMIVQFHQNQKGFKAGGKYEVVPSEKTNAVYIRSLEDGKKTKLPLDKTENFQVYQRQQTPIAMGDLIRVTANGKTQEGTKVHNGQTYQVEGLTKTGDLMLSNGKTLSKEYRNFRHAYVSTSHASQGKDAQDVIISQSALSFGASNEKQFYVSASRGTERLTIYTDNKEELRKSIVRSGDRMSAGEVAKKHHSRIERQRQAEYYRMLNEKSSKQKQLEMPRHRETDPKKNSTIEVYKS